MLLAGDEMGNSQGGNNNPYCLDSPVTWLDWSDRKTAEIIRTFVKELISFRKAHPMLSRAAAGKEQISSGYPAFSCHSEKAWFEGFDYQSRHVGIMMCGTEDGKESYIYIACNLHWDPQTLALPYLPEGLTWTIAIDTDPEAGFCDGNEEIRKEITLPERTIRVLVSRAKQDVQVKE